MYKYSRYSPNQSKEESQVERDNEGLRVVYISAYKNGTKKLIKQKLKDWEREWVPQQKHKTAQPLSLSWREKKVYKDTERERETDTK